MFLSSTFACIGRDSLAVFSCPAARAKKLFRATFIHPQISVLKMFLNTITSIGCAVVRLVVSYLTFVGTNKPEAQIRFIELAASMYQDRQERLNITINRFKANLYIHNTLKSMCVCINTFKGCTQYVSNSVPLRRIRPRDQAMGYQSMCSSKSKLKASV